MPRLTIIVPVLHDAPALESFAHSLGLQKEIDYEVIVVDGAEKKEVSLTRRLSKKNSFRYFSAPKGRGRQMNFGSQKAKSDLLLFLHADSEFTSPYQLRDAVALLEKKPSKKRAGHFRIRFRGNKAEFKFAFSFLEAKSALNRPNTTNGDQGLLIFKEYFFELGAFPESLPFLEDQAFIEKLRIQRGTLITLPHLLMTSARRFEEEGFIRRYFLMMVIMGAYKTDTQIFFEKAPALYVEPDETEKLIMEPFFNSISELQTDLDRREFLHLWQALGAFARENIWQVFMLSDMALLGKEEGPFLAIYTRFLEGNLNNKAVDSMMGISAYTMVTKLAPTVYKGVNRARKVKKKIFGLRSV